MGLMDRLGDGPEQVNVPTSDSGRAPAAREKVAVWFGDGEEPSQFPGDWVRVPEDVAEELGLKSGQRLVVEQRPLKHFEASRVVKQASDPEGYVDTLDLLQVVIEVSVQGSNFGLPGLRVVPGADGEEYLDAPNTVWWLVSWLGVRDLLEQVQQGVGEDALDFRQRSGGR